MVTLGRLVSLWRGTGKDPKDVEGNGEEQETRSGEAREQNQEGAGRKKGQRARVVTREMGQK